MKDKKDPKKPLIYYYGIALIVVLLLNALVFPYLLKQEITQVDYGTFLSLIDRGKVKSVEVQDFQIAFVAMDEKNKESLYITGLMDDPDLTKRLLDAKIEFSRIIPRENSPLINFIMSWILPIGFFLAMGQLLSRSMQKRMGGTMSFGKSNAKIYIESQTGKTFADVAGQDEAKEALTEIVDYLHNPLKYKDIGAIMPKGALLVGPPGTGKTLLAQAVAGESKVPFFSISGSEFVEMFVGMGPHVCVTSLNKPRKKHHVSFLLMK